MMCDVIIVGSGFGGAVLAYRLAKSGLSVLVLERGRRWSPDDYPRGPDDAWLYDVDEPEKQNGWLDLRIFDDMWVAQGAGVGGGSLIYANVSIDAQPEMLNAGWPRQISYDVLKPFYELAAEALRPQELPDNQLTPRFELMRDAAAATGAGERFRKLPLAIAFDPDGRFPKERPATEEAAKTFTNAFGRQQGYCTHTGNCVIGCKARAKNTLDLNYLAGAESCGAEIRPLSVVSHVAQEGDSYAVVYHELAQGKKIPRVARGRRVILAAGSLGSTELLFRSRDRFRTLPRVSRSLGASWSSNGDFLTPAFYSGRVLSPSLGPTITAAIDYLDGSDNAARYFVEDGGFPDLGGNLARVRQKKGRRFGLMSRLLIAIAKAVDDGDPLETLMPWFGQAMDGGNGRLYYGRDRLRPWKRRLKLDWDARRSERGVNGLAGAHRRLTQATGGRDLNPITWTIFRSLVTPHPLGGCAMAASPAAGVVDHRCHVFGYPGLYVADGSVFPRPIGLNPSKTIAALAERTATLIHEEMGI
jgi:cholesterol oxidase